MVQLSLPQHSKVSEGKTFGKDGKTETRFRKVNLQTNSDEIKTIEPKARVY